MIWLALLVAVLVAVATAAAVLGRVDGSLAEATTTASHVPLPDDELTAGDLDGLRFDTALRGYRMSQVDAVIDRLRREITDLEDRIGGRPAAQPDARPEARPEIGPDPAYSPSTGGHEAYTRPEEG